MIHLHQKNTNELIVIYLIKQLLADRLFHASAVQIVSVARNQGVKQISGEAPLVRVLRRRPAFADFSPALLRNRCAFSTGDAAEKFVRRDAETSLGTSALPDENIVHYIALQCICRIMKTGKRIGGRFLRFPRALDSLRGRQLRLSHHPAVKGALRREDQRDGRQPIRSCMA